MLTKRALLSGGTSGCSVTVSRSLFAGEAGQGFDKDGPSILDYETIGLERPIQSRWKGMELDGERDGL